MHEYILNSLLNKTKRGEGDTQPYDTVLVATVSCKPVWINSHCKLSKTH